MIVIGIDPGLSGGIAVLPIGSGQTYATGMPETEKDIWLFLSNAASEHGPIELAVIEKVHSFPKQGLASTFTFGTNYGFLRGLLVASEIRFDEVSPQKWQKAFSLPTLKEMDDSITAKKNAHKQKAQQLFPALKVTHATADALLIAEYTRQRAGMYRMMGRPA